ncbi:MAG: cytochrome, partial [Proteobacteria bacterium]|nr:cytochrome [Pseudomonadota bacterium]
MTQRVYIFKGFERFWHWSQAGLIIFLMLTGFEIHGTYTLFGFEKAVHLHSTAAWTLVGLWIFAIFWHFTTGEWRHYIPTREKILTMAKYYSSGIFKHEPHPFKPSPVNKHNPLQRLTYLAILTLLSPLIWITGWLYLFYADWP